MIRFLRPAVRWLTIGTLLWWAWTMKAPLARHIEILAFDPLVMLTAAGQGIGLATLLAVTLFLLSPLLAGRFFCGWLCPVGTLSELSLPVRRAKRLQRLAGGIDARLRFALLLASILSIPAGIALTGWIDPNIMSVRLVTAVTRIAAGGPIGPLPVILIILLAVTFLTIPRLWCRKFCPIGALLSIVSIKRYWVRKIAGNCTGCGRCQRHCPMGAISEGGLACSSADCISCLKCAEVCPAAAISFGRRAPERGTDFQPSRRDFLKLTAAGVLLPLAMRLFLPAGRLRGLLRPPGSLPEKRFNARCLRCHKCIKVCPTGALVPATLEYPLEALWTPRLAPPQGRCELCFSCADVCPAGIIKKVPIKNVRIGTARIDRSRCLGWAKGKLCLVCVEQCPVLAVTADNSPVPRPIMNEHICVGCGACENSCPLKPAAIKVFPLV